MTSQDRVRIFDTTLRDGEQTAGINLNTVEKLQIAHQLARMKVDVIEAGFPAASPGDLEAVKAIARAVQGPIIAGLARTRENDIRAAHEAVKDAERSRIHTFIATSDIHIEHKLKLTRAEVLREVEAGVSLARSLVDDVEFSAEDASRSDLQFLIEVFRLAARCGATTLNIPDTVGYGVPREFGQFVSAIISAVGQEGITWSVHCHDDLGLAVANSLEAVRNGARQVECTINGIGERAGNASMEEIVMGLRTRKDQFGVETGLDTKCLYGISGLVSRLTGFAVPRNKAIVGGNAFAHEAGIHQHGVLCNRATYEIMTPEDVGAPGSQLVLGKHSGRHAFTDHLEKKGYYLDREQVQEAFMLFKALCDRKEIVTESDLEALIVDEILAVTPQRSFVLKDYMVQVGPGGRATANVVLGSGEKELADAATGNGPVDAAYAAVRRITGLEPELRRWEIRAVTEKADAIGEAQVTLAMDGRQVHGRGASTDVIEASLKAYVNAMNRLIHLISAGKMAQPCP